MLEKIKFHYENNKTFRTFIQTFIGYLVANMAYGIQQMITDGKEWYRVLICTLLVPAVATALSAVMNRNSTKSVKTEDDSSKVG